MTAASYVPRPDTLLSKTTTASRRALSPAPQPRPTASKMPSPRASPALRPQSPLSPRFESTSRFDPLGAPSSSAQRRGGAVGNSQRRANTQSLRLPSLPRFHPANFPSHSSSHHSSADNTPDAPDVGSPLSPRAQHSRRYNDAQKHLFVYQHDMVSAAVRASSPGGLDEPHSPKLVPIGSPGPVTPLELEAEADSGGYLVAGMRSVGGQDGPAAAREMVDEMIRQEAGHLHRGSASRHPSHGR